MLKKTKNHGGFISIYMKKAFCDMHTHSVFSHDATKNSSVMALCRRAAELGFTDIAITDHCDTDGEKEGIYIPYDRDAAWAEMTKAKEIFHGKLNVLRGIELGQPSYYPEYTKKILSSHPYEFIIGSVHNLRGVPDFCMMKYENMPVPLAAQLFDRTLDEMFSIADFPIDTLAHMTYQNRYMAISKMKFDFSPFKDKIAALFEKLIKNDIALELNVSTLWRGYGFTMPHEELLKLYKAVGGTLFTIGSDAHSPENLGKCIGEGMEMLGALGFSRLLVVRDGKKEIVRF